MATLESLLYDQLAATSAITDETSTRIYRGRRPQDTSLPAITYQRVSTTAVNHATGATDTAFCTIQINALAANQGTARTIADAIKTALKTWTQTTVAPKFTAPPHLQNDVDVPEDPNFGEQDAPWMIAQDWLFGYSEV